MKKIGYEPSAKGRAADFFLEDSTVRAARSFTQVEVYPLKDIFEKSELSAYSSLLWSLISKNKDEVTKKVSDTRLGFFLRVPAGVKVSIPFQACFFLKASRFMQRVHNLIVVEDGASLHIINGCATASYSTVASHYAVTEIFVGKNAFLSYTMIHDWGPEVEVMPRTAVKIEDGGNFISNYMILSPVRRIHSMPQASVGKEGSASFYSIIYSTADSFMDLGAHIELNEKASGQIVSRVVAESGHVISRGVIIGKEKDSRGHMECSAVLLGNSAIVEAIPTLQSRHPESILSHEAAIGKIAQEEIIYLMARGLSEAEALSLILKGFLEIKIPGLPPEVNMQIEKTVELSLRGF